jgi:hypothetical protein
MVLLREVTSPAKARQTLTHPSLPTAMMRRPSADHVENHGPGCGSDGETEEDWLDMRTAIREHQFNPDTQGTGIELRHRFYTGTV